MSEEEKKAIETIKKDNEYFEKHNIKTNASILLNLIEKQQKEIENSVSKDKIRDMQRLREFELQQEYEDFEEDTEWKTYKKILGE